MGLTLKDIPAYVIGCDEFNRKEITLSHLEKHGANVKYFRGIHGTTWGLKTILPGDRYPDGSPWYMSTGCVALVVNQMMLIQHCILSDYENVIIFEDDAYFPVGASEQINEVLNDLPKDYDVIYLGWLHEGHNRTMKQIKGRLHNQVNDCIFGTHAMLYSKKGLRKVFDTNQAAQKPWDIALWERALPKLNYYVCYPSIVTQRSKQGDWNSTL